MCPSIVSFLLHGTDTNAYDYAFTLIPMNTHIQLYSQLYSYKRFGETELFDYRN
jgi:hypothetical protein